MNSTPALDYPDSYQLLGFLKESLSIEGIYRHPTQAESDITEGFLRNPLTMKSLLELQSVYAPGKPLRNKVGMNVRVGNYTPPPGCLSITHRLTAILKNTNQRSAYLTHHHFESLHPFMDGNGRTGRTLWLWQRCREVYNPLVRNFLHSWYYSSLDNFDLRNKQ